MTTKDHSLATASTALTIAALASQDLFIGQAGELEKFQWFVRAHLENSGGQLANKGATTEKGAARSAKKKSPVK